LVIPKEDVHTSLLQKEDAAEHTALDRPIRADTESQALTALTEEVRQEPHVLEIADAENRFNQQMEVNSVLISRAVQAITKESESMFIRLEAEVVKLSLEIARKILSHEAQIDPMFLAGAVRIAIDRIKATTKLTLQVAPENIHSWQQVVSASQDRLNGFHIVGDESIEPGMCICRSGNSRLDLSAQAQIGEISNRFSEIFADENPGHRLNGANLA
jgi:flagellar biosynthesis/type III secretory pathway protein FliH